MHTFLLSLEICIFSAIILSNICAGADPFYETCLPTNCGSGPNISFPFHVTMIQQSYCGYPGFLITCRNGVPILQMSENEYVVEDIFYHNRSLHVYNAAANRSSCIPRIRNTTLPEDKFGYVNVTYINLLFDCRNISEELLRYEVGCGSFGERDNGTLALYGGDGDLRNALGRCQENIVAPVELYDDEKDDEVVDVAEVLRRGFLMNWIASDCSGCEESGGRCGFNQTSFHFRCFCPDKPLSRSCVRPENYTPLKKILFIGGMSVAVLTSILIILLIFVRRKRARAKEKYEKNIKLFLKNNGNLASLRYKYSSIKKMTKSFSENLGKGGCGSVYKGQLPEGHPVAVKILNESNENGEDFMNEVASISRTSHVNIVALLGFCFEGPKRALVYDFMPNGSLEKFIGSTVSSTSEIGLGWDKLFEIALGIARGLEYLHHGCNTRILHLDIKPQNILLDKDLNPRISDFGLAKLCPNRSSIVSMMVARGTIGYIAPEVFSRNFGEVSYKSDVYSYGMLILDMVGGRKYIDREDVDQTSEIYFPHYIYKQLEMDADISKTMNEDEDHVSKRNLSIVGLWCIQTNPKDRPSMMKVVEMLEGKFGALEVPPKPYYSPPRSAPTISSSSQSM